MPLEGSESVAITIDLLRHGEPVGGRRYRGQVDDPLNEAGWRQMRAAVGDGGPWRSIVTSPLRRCADFAHWLGQTRGLPVREDARLKEVGLGAWEGLSPEEVRRADPGLFGRYFQDPCRNRPQGAEPLETFYERVGAVWTELMDDHAGGHPLIVAHAGVIRAVVCRVLEIPIRNMLRLQVANAAFTRIRSDGSSAGPVLVFHNQRV